MTRAAAGAAAGLGSSDEGNDPASSTTRQAYDLLAEGFGPGFNGPLILVRGGCGQAPEECRADSHDSHQDRDVG